MIICGIKLTHDGAIALIDNGKLIFSYEMEKLENMPRYSGFCISMARIEEILAEHGYSFSGIDQLVIDGWGRWDPADIGTTKSKEENFIVIPDGKNNIEIHELADYGHLVRQDEDILAASRFKTRKVELPYKSYKHVTGHVLGAYCTSPFARKKEDSFVLVWDGGMPPQLFYYKYNENEILNLGTLFLLTGYTYINFAQAFEPFSLVKPGDLSVAGKAMAYMALGKVEPDIMAKYGEIFNDLNEEVREVEIDMNIIAMITAEFIKQAKQFCTAHKKAHPNMLTTFQVFVQNVLIENLRKKIQEHPGLHNNLCFAGGSALNIKWNSAIRDSGIFSDVWVPPFPNDSGSAIGTACCEMVMTDNIRSLDWNVYSGPSIKDMQVENPQYAAYDCELDELAYILYEYNEPVVFLNGSAELGPRALGNRSILAAAVTPDMKKILNKAKDREDYRPVAPICLEEAAPNIFDPGSPDPYMLFEHQVKPGWKDKVPAICHLDGTARLQTVNKNENPVIYELLTHYKKLSGVPLLCNTSANFNGSGFFPDVESAMEWDGVNLIWSAGKLYAKDKVAHILKSLKKDYSR